MFDLVLNHCSTQHRWFQDYLADRRPGSGYFIEADPRADYSRVTRPRSTPLLTPFQTAGGTRHIWTTFSDDQVDLNWKNPEVLVEMLDTLLFYVHQAHGSSASMLWRISGSRWAPRCIHLPEAHTVVKLIAHGT